MKTSKLALPALLLLAPLAWSAVTPQPSKKKKKLTLQEMLQKAGGSKQPSTTVAGVRGLDETNGEVDTKARDYVSIEKLESVVIHEDELKKFRDEGKLR